MRLPARRLFLLYSHREVLLGIVVLQFPVASRWDLDLVDQVGQDVALMLNVLVKALWV